MCVIHSQWCLNSDVSTKKVVISIQFGTKRQAEVAKVSVELFVHEFSCEAALIDGDSCCWAPLLVRISCGICSRPDMRPVIVCARLESSLRNGKRMN